MQLLVETLIWNPGDYRTLTEDREVLESVLGEDGNPVLDDDGHIVERKVKRKVTIIEGPFQRYGVRNANRRLYTEELWDGILGENGVALTKLNARRMIGQLEHPPTGATDLKESAIVTTKLTKRNDGVIWGRAEVLNDTPNGRIARALIEAKVQIGISSRGRGTVNGEGVVNNDYILDTFDLVANPSTPGAFPSPSQQRENIGEGARNEGDLTLESTQNHKEKAMSLQDTFLALESRHGPLAEADIRHLSPTELSRVANEAIEAIGDINEAEADHPGIADLTAPLKRKLTETRLAAKRMMNTGVQVIAEDNTANDGGADEPDLADNIRNVIENDPRYTEDDDLEEEDDDGDDFDDDDFDAVEEVDAMREILRQAGDEMDENDNRLEAAMQLCEALAERCAQAEAYADALEERYEAAMSILEAQQYAAASDALSEAADEIVSEYPVLQESRGLLESCDNVDEMHERADQLLRLARRGGRRRERDDLPPRTSLVESEQDPDLEGNVPSTKGRSKSQPINENAPRGAKIAVTAVKRLNQK